MIIDNDPVGNPCPEGPGRPGGIESRPAGGGYNIESFNVFNGPGAYSLLKQEQLQVEQASSCDNDQKWLKGQIYSNFARFQSGVIVGSIARHLDGFLIRTFHAQDLPNVLRAVCAGWLAPLDSSLLVLSQSLQKHIQANIHGDGLHFNHHSNIIC